MKFFYVIFCFLIFSCDLPSEEEVDCNGVQYGQSVLDLCGVCDGENEAMDCRKDLFGENPDYCYGDFYLDQCDVCDNTFDNDNLTCLGCDGIPNSNLEVDDCGVCGGNNLCDCPGFPEGTIMDCLGECGGQAVVDDCDICNGNNDSFGCDGQCLNNIEDICGECAGPGVINCYCDSYIQNNNQYTCDNINSSAPYSLDEELGCDVLETELSMCYPEDCDTEFSLSDFEGKIIWIIYEADW